MNARQYDAIIIGSGQGGGPLSTALTASGRTVALIERAYIGGTCINYGCTPTKTMVASARVAWLAREAGRYGVRDGDVSVDMGVVRRRKREIVESFRFGSTQHIEAGDVDIIHGEARFTGPKSLKVKLNGEGEVGLEAELIVIDTGTRPAVPPVAGLKDVPFLDSTSIMELDTVPEHLIVLGGGYVGLEFGQMFRRFGSAVTVVQALPHLMGREDEDMVEAVTHVLQEDGIEILLNATARAASSNGGTISLEVDTPDGARTVTGSHLLVATGRVPNTEALHLPAAGIETDKRGFIKVDGRLRTTSDSVYALGDVTGQPQFTHISYDDFRILRDNLLTEKDRTTEGRLIPYVMFIDPQFARVGVTEAEARAAGRGIRVAKMRMNHVARALEVDEPRGLMKAVVDAGTDQILGCAVFGLEGGEIMAMMEIAMMGRLPYTALRDGIFAHPTLAESLNNLFSSFTE